jgi:hypothetical protein
MKTFDFIIKNNQPLFLYPNDEDMMQEEMLDVVQTLLNKGKLLPDCYGTIKIYFDGTIKGFCVIRETIEFEKKDKMSFFFDA